MKIRNSWQSRVFLGLKVLLRDHDSLLEKVLIDHGDVFFGHQHLEFFVVVLVLGKIGWMSKANKTDRPQDSMNGNEKRKQKT